MKYLAWFSAGAASAVATKLALAEYDDVTIYRTAIASEHPDNDRFAAECADWFGQEIHNVTGDEVELKKKARFKVERDYDAQIFGYTADEQRRADRFRLLNPDVALVTPLLDRGLGKADCLAMVERAGIELPAMYRLGYRNNNCIGCVKGGMGYWNKVRVDFPETFDRMAVLERKLGHSVIRVDGEPVWLDQLDPTRGNHQDEPDVECSLLCAIAEEDLGS